MSLNLWFFGIYFLIVASVHVLHAFLTDPVTTGSTYLFATYTLLQSALETLVLLIVGATLKWRYPKLLTGYTCFVLTLLLCHLIDFPLERFMDMQVWEGMQFVVQGGYANFIGLLMAANIPLKIWALGFGCMALFIGIGVAIYRFLDRRSIHIKNTSLLVIGAFCLCAVISLDYALTRSLPMAHLFRLHKALPWKTTLFFSPLPKLSLPATLKSALSHEEKMQTLDSRAFSLLQKPDIYIIVIESLRHDFINQINTPKLHAFKEQNISFPFAFSSANATHLSWFSIFHSQYAFHWEAPHQSAMKGSLPLHLLKTMGYQVHTFSSTDLSYYQMNNILFGKEETLSDTLFTSDQNLAVYERDEQAVGKMIDKIQEPGAGRAFLLFLDATHFDYSYPDRCAQFTPCGEGANYLDALFSKQAPQELVNRYQNSLLFIDSQLEKLLGVIGEDAIVVITADHGEEFYEKGNLFHASMLSKEQITPPLYYQFPKKGRMKEKVACHTTSHVDIFPSIFHYLTGSEDTAPLFDGESIFQKTRKPFTVVARFNASQTPTEYCLHTNALKLTFEFEQPNIFEARSLRLLSTKTFEDEPVHLPTSSLEESFGPAIEHLFRSP